MGAKREKLVTKKKKKKSNKGVTRAKGRAMDELAERKKGGRAESSRRDRGPGLKKTPPKFSYKGPRTGKARVPTIKAATRQVLLEGTCSNPQKRGQGF